MRHYDLINANEKFLVGEAIDNVELKLLLKFYSDLEEKLGILGERYHLAWKEVRSNRQRLDEMKTARKSK